MRSSTFIQSLLGIALLAALTLSAIGCGGKEKSLVGKWKVDISLTEEEKKNPLAGMAQGFAGAFTLEFKADNTFSMSMMFPLEGTWSLSGDKVTLEVTKAMGTEVPAEQRGKNNMELTLSSDGKSLTMAKKPDDKSDRETKFVKEEG